MTAASGAETNVWSPHTHTDTIFASMHNSCKNPVYLVFFMYSHLFFYRECLCWIRHLSADAHYQCHDGVRSHHCKSFPWTLACSLNSYLIACISFILSSRLLIVLCKSKKKETCLQKQFAFKLYINSTRVLR